MELKDFVAETITQICQGVLIAKEKNKDTDVVIAPHVSSSGETQPDKERQERPQLLHFDLKIIVSDSTKDGKQGGSFHINVVGFGISAKSGDNSSSSTESKIEQHISFDLPIIWPSNQKRIDTSSMPIQRQAETKYDPLKW